MVLPRWLAHFNVAFTNRLMLPVADTPTLCYDPALTPVNVCRRGDRYLFALTYSPQSEWVHNVLAAGECTLVTRGRRTQLVEPRRFSDPRRRDMPWIVRIGLGVLDVSEFLELRRASAES